MEHANEEHGRRGESVTEISIGMKGMNRIYRRCDSRSSIIRGMQQSIIVGLVEVVLRIGVL